MWKVNNIDDAGWAFKRIADANKKIHDVDDYVQREIDRIKAWADKEKAPHINTKEFFEAHLENYMRSLPDGEKLSTPYGRVTKRTAPKWRWDDEKALEWAKKAGYIRTTESVDKNAIKKAVVVAEDGAVVSTGGEVVPGVTAKKETTYKVVTTDEGY